MIMELTARYGMEFNPFLKNSKEILYTGSEYKEEIQKLANADIVGGMGEGKYAPDALVTRAQASVFISNILDAMQ